jgi:FMN phosphatase YigB (HAD superfamily)
MIDLADSISAAPIGDERAASAFVHTDTAAMADGGLSAQAAAIADARRLMDDPRKSVITFDVFDTFLVRRCTAPDGVFERTFSHLSIAEKKPGLIESFVQHRVLAELRARERLVDEAKTGEVTIREIYQRFPRHVLGLEYVSIDDLVAAEFQAELDLCLVNPEIAELLREAQDRYQPLRTGFVSDTYWSAAHLRELLKKCAPGLRADFIYTSSDHRTCKAATLFERVLQGECYSGTDAIHIGDNPLADILGARAFDIAAIHYPQAHEPILPIWSREVLAAQLLRSKRTDFSQRLDQGLHIARRLALSKLPHLSAGERDAAAVFGPALAGFQHFIRRRIDKVLAQGGKPAVVFLGRDGYLQFQLWQSSQPMSASYAEINRRVGLVANLRQIRALQDVFVTCNALNEASVQAFLKVDLPSIKQYFSERIDGIVDGKTFAEDLPRLLTADDVAALSDVIRDQLLEHLRHAIPAFDSCTDLILVDLGYAGTIQRALRGVFDQVGLTHRLHGVYFASVDDNFVDLPDGDTVAGYIDASIVPPAIKLFLLRNIAVLEQICSAPQGSVRYYEHGIVQREHDIRPPRQRDLCQQLQLAIIQFATEFDLAATELRINIDQAIDNLRDWSCVHLLRLLAFPTLAEQECYGQLQHDVNLGTYLLFDLINTDSIEKLQGAMAMPAAMRAEAPPMWLGGSMAAISGLASCAYGLSAFGLPTSEMLADQVATHIQTSIVKDGQSIACAASCLVTAGGDLRLRIPVLQRHTGSIVAIPLAKFLQHGLIRSVVIQRGDNIGQAMSATDIEPIDRDRLSGLHCRLDGMQFTALLEEAHLLLAVRESSEKVSLVTITVLPLAPQMSTLPSSSPVQFRGAA